MQKIRRTKKVDYYIILCIEQFLRKYNLLKSIPEKEIENLVRLITIEELETIGKNQLCNRHQTQIVLHVCGGGEEGVVLSNPF